MTAAPDFIELRRHARTEGRFLFAEAEGTLWHFPRAVPGEGALVLRNATCHGRASRHRLARAARQDLWRACQRVRGFWPVIGVTARDDGVELTVGAILPHPAGPAAARIQDVISQRRARWADQAARPARGDG